MDRVQPLRAHDESKSREPLRGHYGQKARGALMAQATLVEMQINEGQRLIDRLAKEGVAVTGAAWVKESENGDWYLYVVTPLVGEDGATKPAYRRVNRVIREMQKEGFGMA